MHLISVDLPAPLSPTSAMTSPERTSKSTSVSASTWPKLFETLRASSVGAVSSVGVGVVSATASVTSARPPWGGGGAHRSAPAGWLVLLAVLLELAATDVALLQIPVEEDLVVLLVDVLRRVDVRGRLLGLVRHRPRRPRLVAGQERLCRPDGLGGEQTGVLPHRHRLPAGDDVLHALLRRVLTGERDRLQLLRLQRRDDGAGEAVVRGCDRVDLVSGPDEHLLEDRPCLLVVPAGDELVRTLLEGAVLEQRVEDRVVPALEQIRVVVGRAAVQPGDDRVLAVLPVRLQALDHALALQNADLLALERDVDVADAADDLAVVLDDLCALRLRRLLDRERGAEVERDEHDDLGAVREALVGLRALLLSVTVGVGDRVGDPCLLGSSHECRTVLRLPADRCLRVGEQETDVATFLRFALASRDGPAHGRRNPDDGDREHNHKPCH